MTRLLGLDFADLEVTEAAAWIDARPADAPFGYVVTPNADHLVRLQDDPALEAVYRAALLRLLDSRVIARVARAIGLPSPKVATGSDLTAILLQRHVRPAERITIVGLDAAWVGPLMASLGLPQPNHYNPPMGFWRHEKEVDRAVSFVLDHPARLIVLAVGSPQQEWLAAVIASTGRAHGTGLCVGASLAFLAGAECRAPRWMQAAGLEWSFRLSRDPRRLARRYLVESPKVLGMLAAERWPRLARMGVAYRARRRT